MGRLIPAAAFQNEALADDPTWFAPTQWHHGSGANDRRRVNWRAAFPRAVAMHFNALPLNTEEGQARRREIRRWIERELPGTVILDRKTLDYRALPPVGDFAIRPANMDHGYHVFRFEEAAEAVLFALRFSEWVSLRMTVLHPDHPEGWTRPGVLPDDPELTGE